MDSSIVQHTMTVEGIELTLTPFKVPDGSGSYRDATTQETEHLIRTDRVAAFIFEGICAPATPMKTGTIYFVESEDRGLIKIGFTTGKVSKRMLTLQTGSASPLKLLATCSGTPAVERWYHQNFIAFKQSGEWFTPAPEILAEIARLCAALSRGVLA